MTDPFCHNCSIYIREPLPQHNGLHCPYCKQQLVVITIGENRDESFNEDIEEIARAKKKQTD